MSARESLLAALLRQPVEFKVMGQDVLLQPLTAQDVADMRAYQEKHGDESGYRLAFVRSVRGLDGVRLFTDDDAEQVSQFDGFEVGRVNAKVAELNRLGDAAGKAPSPPNQN